MPKILFLLFLSVACAAGKMGTSSVNDKAASIIVDKDLKDMFNFSPSGYALLEYAIQADTLKLKILSDSLSSFRLITNGRRMKSNPPQVNIYLLRSDTPATKGKAMAREMRFILSPLKMPDEEKLILNINTTKQKTEYIY